MTQERALLWAAALAKRLGRTLNSEEMASVSTLPFRSHALPVETQYYSEGTLTVTCALMQDGVLCQSKLTSCGNRQIIGVRLGGEFVGLSNVFLRDADHDAQALTPCRLIELDPRSIGWLAHRHPEIGRTLVADALVTGAIAQDWIINIGRRDAKCRVAHLLCEFALRIDGSGLTPGSAYKLPFNQQQLGDAVGLGRVAVNRILRELVALRLISHDRGCITILDARQLEEVGDFSARYLHLGQSGHDRRRGDRSAATRNRSMPFASIPSPVRNGAGPDERSRSSAH